MLYHQKEKGFDREALRTEHLDQEKMEYLFTAKDSGKTYYYGLNLSDMVFLREFPGLSHQVMFMGIAYGYGAEERLLLGSFLFERNFDPGGVKVGNSVRLGNDVAFSTKL